MSSERYGGPAMLMHWLHAALLVALLIVGWSMVDLPKGAERSAAIGLHKSLGLCALLLFFLRAPWRLYVPPPAEEILRPVERRLAKATHAALYLLFFLVPLAGYLSASFTAYPMRFFGIDLPKAGWPDEGWNRFFNGAHRAAVWALVACIVLHVVAALGHALRRDGLLSRMLPRMFSRSRSR